jgi:PAS domain S-box-containing protein
MTQAEILIVDDTPENLRLLTKLLSKQGYQIRLAPNGEQALAVVENNMPDLIILDIIMPNMDGYTVCERLKANESTRDIPVIFLSALNEVMNKVRAFEVGGVDYITKPFQEVEIVNRVRTHLSLSNMRKQLKTQNDRLRQSEDALRKLSRAVNQSGSTIVITDLRGTIEFVNPAFSKITGYTAQEAVGKNLSLLKSGKVSSEVYKDLWTTISHGNVWEGELLNRKKNGELYWEFTTISPVKDEVGNVTHYVAVKENITERKRAEETIFKANKRMQNDLKLAKKIQQSLLPPPRPNWSDIEVVCFSNSAEEVGGDFYQYHSLGSLTIGNRKSKRYAIAVGDTSGKGVSAALLMATSLAQFDASLLQPLSPTELLIYLDEMMLPYTKPHHQNCAMCYVEVEVLGVDDKEVPQPSILTIVNAGCIPPYIKRINGEVEFYEIGGFALGQGLGMEMGYQEHVVQLFSGDMVILTSDGVVEANNKTGDMLGFERLEQIVRQGPTTGAEDMLNHFKQAVFTFTSGEKQHDDMTVVIIRV